MFLLSYSEATNSNYGFTDALIRKAQGSDYAKCQGLDVYINNGDWWLRSPYSSNAFYAYNVNSFGSIVDDHRVSFNLYGVRPACWINLS
jgi:hypothetical protein